MVNVSEDFSNNGLRVFVSRDELVATHRYIPQVIANRVADKYIEENWDKLMADTAFVSSVSELAKERIAERVVEQVGAQLAKVLKPNGGKDDN